MKKIHIAIVIALVVIISDVLILEDDSVEETAIRENILTDSNVIDLGNYITAYRTSSDIIDTNYKGAYLAIHDLGGGEILYLPDVYQEVYEIKIEDKEEVFISYNDIENNGIQSVHIPIRFPTQVNNEYEIHTLQEKILTEVQNNINACTDALPRLIWKENISREGKAYEIQCHLFCQSIQFIHPTLPV